MGGFFSAPTGLTTKANLDVCSTLGFPGLAPWTHHGHCFPFLVLAPVGDGGGCCRSIRSPSHSPSERMGGVAGEGAVPMPVSIPPLSYHTCTAQHTRAPFKHSYVVCAVAICTYVHACMHVCMCFSASVIMSIPQQSNTTRGGMLHIGVN